MKAVLDTSVVIDLHHGGLLEALFKLPYNYIVPEAMFEKELKEWIGERLIGFGLIITVLEGLDVVLAQEFMRRCRRLSQVDAYALVLAARGGYTLFSGDEGIREFAKEIEVKVCGILGVMDMIESAKLLSPASLHSCLMLIVRNKKAWLPRDEINARFARYEAASFVVTPENQLQ